MPIAFAMSSTSLGGVSCPRHEPGTGGSGGCQGWSCTPLRPASLGGVSCPWHEPGTGGSGGSQGWYCTPLRPPDFCGETYSWPTVGGDGGVSCHRIGSAIIQRHGRQWNGEWWTIQDDVQAEGPDCDDWSWVEDGHPGQWRWLRRLQQWTWSGSIGGGPVRLWAVAEREDEVGYLWWWHLEAFGLREQDDFWTLGPAAPSRYEWALRPSRQ